MKKFKKGDKVKVIDNKADSLNVIGDIGIIIEMDNIYLRVLVEGREDYANNQYIDDIELYNEEPNYEIY